MMWKESYRIGIGLIDEQHIELFRMTDNLLAAIEQKAGAEEYRKAVDFLKDYVIYHFGAEEAYQASIGYEDAEAHKQLHRDFAALAEDFVRRLEQSEYSLPIVKELAGILTSWLIYHVADTDQRIARPKPVPQQAQSKSEVSYMHSFSTSMLDVLETMAGLDPACVQKCGRTDGRLTGDVFVRIGLVGDVRGDAVFAFSKELAFKLVEIMTMIRPVELDEFVCSALAELSNITSGNAASGLAHDGLSCEITTPTVSLEQQALDPELDGLVIDTGIGGLEVALKLHK